MTRPGVVYLKVLVPAAATIAAMFILEKVGIAYIEALAQSRRDMTLAERVFASATIWIERYVWFAVAIILPGALLLASWLAHSARARR